MYLSDYIINHVTTTREFFLHSRYFIFDSSHDLAFWEVHFNFKPTANIMVDYKDKTILFVDEKI